MTDSAEKISWSAGKVPALQDIFPALQDIFPALQDIFPVLQYIFPRVENILPCADIFSLHSDIFLPNHFSFNFIPNSKQANRADLSGFLSKYVRTHPPNLPDPRSKFRFKQNVIEIRLRPNPSCRVRQPQPKHHLKPHPRCRFWRRSISLVFSLLRHLYRQSSFVRLSANQ